MNSVQNPSRPLLRFSIRGVMLLTLLIALLLGWRSSVQRAGVQLRQQAKQLVYAEQELARARDELESRGSIKPDKSRAFWLAQLEGANLAGMTISSPGNAFQRASFQGCNLEHATLQGGVSAFQLARFDKAKLAGAKLSGGNASFQHATFVGADLTDAVLTGSGSSFQMSSFENATLVRACLAGSFQAVNISGAHFEAADLSSLDSHDLASCYFKIAPSYDEQTKFPVGFHPEAMGWRRITE